MRPRSTVAVPLEAKTEAGGTNAPAGMGSSMISSWWAVFLGWRVRTTTAEDAQGKV